MLSIDPPTIWTTGTRDRTRRRADTPIALPSGDRACIVSRPSLWVDPPVEWTLSVPTKAVSSEKIVRSTADEEER